jgi:hypothetical protein
LTFCSPPAEPSYEDSSPIDLYNDPIMGIIENPETIECTQGELKWTLKLKASYQARGIVLGRKNYGGGWNAIVAPCDVALAWGELVRDDLYKKLKWSQGNRWYFWHYGEDFDHDNNFVARYSSNNHIIPSTRNLTSVVKSLRNGDIVEFTGYLVDVSAKKGDNDYWWNSSMSTLDTGDGSCEVIYLTKIKIRDKVYQ